MADTPSFSKRLARSSTRCSVTSAQPLTATCPSFGVQAHDDVPGKGLAGAGDEFGLLDRLGADDAIGDAGLQIAGDGGLVPNAAADLDGQVRVLRRDGADGLSIHRLPGEGPV